MCEPLRGRRTYSWYSICCEDIAWLGRSNPPTACLDAAEPTDDDDLDSTRQQTCNCVCTVCICVSHLPHVSIDPRNGQAFLPLSICFQRVGRLSCQFAAVCIASSAKCASSSGCPWRAAPFSCHQLHLHCHAGEDACQRTRFLAIAMRCFVVVICASLCIAVPAVPSTANLASARRRRNPAQPSSANPASARRRRDVDPLIRLTL